MEGGSFRLYVLLAVGCLLAQAATTQLKTKALENETSAKNAAWALRLMESARARSKSAGVPSLTCGACQVVIAVIQEALATPAGINGTLNFGDEFCSKTFPNATDPKILAVCELLIKIVIVDALPFLFREAENMKWNVPLTMCSDIVGSCQQPCCSTNQIPEQVHLSLADSNDLTMMRVTWVTQEATPGAAVSYQVAGSTGTPTVVPEEPSRTYTDGGWLGVIHTAVMTGLQPGTTYTYTVGTDGFFARTFTFSAFPANIGTPARPLRAACLADMGFNGQSNYTVLRLAALASSGEIDIVLHYGDISYADADAHHWDRFYNKIEPIAARVPYMTTPGNHELPWNFSAYKARSGLSMPPAGDGEPRDAMYYTFRVGPVQILMMDTETWLGTPDIPQSQIDWATAQMVKANAQRTTATPWLMVFHHRPLYCTWGSGFTCQVEAGLLRYQAEAMYVAQHVDVVTYGHVHSWERTYPVVDSVVMSRNYTNPPAPVYLLNGAAGNPEGNSMPLMDQPWAAFGSSDIGFARFDFVSNFATGHHELRVRFMRSVDNAVVDAFNLTKTL